MDAVPAVPVPILVSLAIVSGVVLLTYALVPVWVYRDAAARGSDSPLFWALTSAVPASSVVPYLIFRDRRLGARRRPPGPLDRAIRALVAALVWTFVLGVLATPPDPFSQLYWIARALPVALVLSYVLVYRGWLDRLRHRLA